jgi:hypothetical protein
MNLAAPSRNNTGIRVLDSFALSSGRCWLKSPRRPTDPLSARHHGEVRARRVAGAAAWEGRRALLAVKIHPAIDGARVSNSPDESLHRSGGTLGGPPDPARGFKDAECRDAPDRPDRALMRVARDVQGLRPELSEDFDRSGDAPWLEVLAGRGNVLEGGNRQITSPCSLVDLLDVRYSVPMSCKTNPPCASVGGGGQRRV